MVVSGDEYDRDMLQFISFINELGSFKQECKQEFGSVKRELGNLNHEMGHVKHELADVKRELKLMNRKIDVFNNDMLKLRADQVETEERLRHLEG